MARGLSGPAYHCLTALYRARPERASLSFVQPKRASLSFALMPDLRRSPLRVKSAPRAGKRLIILSRMVTHAVASMLKTVKCACFANKVKAGPPGLEFLVIFDFFAPCYGRRKEAFSVKKSQKNSKEKLAKCATKLLDYIRFLYKVVQKSAVSENSIALGRLNLTFLPLRLSLWNLAHLFIMFMATKSLPQIF